MDSDRRWPPWDTLGGSDPLPGAGSSPRHASNNRQGREGTAVNLDKRRARRSSRYRVARWTAAALIVLFVAVTQWLNAAHVHLGQWASGVPHSTIEYLPYLVLIILLILPDTNSIGFGGLKLDMRQTREEVTRLRGDVQNLAQNQHQVVQVVANATGSPVPLPVVEGPPPVTVGPSQAPDVALPATVGPSQADGVARPVTVGPSQADGVALPVTGSPRLLTQDPEVIRRAADVFGVSAKVAEGERSGKAPDKVSGVRQTNAVANEINGMPAGEVEAVKAVIARIGSDERSPSDKAQPVDLPGAPPGTQYLALTPEALKARVVIYRPMLPPRQDGDWLVTALVAWDQYDTWREVVHLSEQGAADVAAAAQAALALARAMFWAVQGTRTTTSSA